MSSASEAQRQCQQHCRPENPSQRRQSDGHPLVTMLRGVHEQTNSTQHATTNKVTLAALVVAGTTGTPAGAGRGSRDYMPDVSEVSLAFSGYTPLCFFGFHPSVRGATRS